MYFRSVKEAEDWIFGLRAPSVKRGLENIQDLCRLLGDPQKDLKFVHVAGTDGKGSTCAMTEKMLRANGYVTGLFTSPHLMRFSERIRISGVPVEDEALLSACEQVRAAADTLEKQEVYPNFFELTTAVSFLVFREAGVNIVVLETGLGGRLDATNVVWPEICLITSIGLDHTKQLGETLPLIAGEKAGIIKENVAFAVSEQADAAVMAVFEEAARAKHAPMTALSRIPWQMTAQDRYGSEMMFDGMQVRVPLPGHHQAQNARLALTGMRLLAEKGWKVDMHLSAAALEKTVWPGRLEWLDEHTLLDGAHNPHGAASLQDYVQTHLQGEKIVAVIGMMRDKAVETCVSIYARCFEQAVATQIDFPRALEAHALGDMLHAAGMEATVEPDMMKALEQARRLAGDGIVLVCGSLYLMGDMRMMLKDDGGIL